MSRKDDLKTLFNFFIELLNEENEIKPQKEEKLLVEETKPKTSKFDVFDVPRIKTIMDKMETKQHENSVVKQALNVQAKDYKREIEELKEAFNKKIFEEYKLEDANTTIIGPDGFSETKKKIN
jgi:hypothetical protein